MTLVQLESFLIVARELSFRRAAEQMHLSQPAVSAQIRNLETELHQSLFDRSARQLALTQAGELLLQYAEHLLALTAEAGQAVADLNSEPQGRIILGATTAMVVELFPPILGELSRRFPRISVKIHTCSNQNIIQNLLAGNIELGLAYTSQMSAGLRSEPFIDDHYVPVCAPQHPFAHRKRVRPDEINGQPMIFLTKDSTIGPTLDRRLAELGLLPDPIMELPTSEAVKKMVEINLGIAVVAQLAVDAELASGQLCLIPMPELQLLEHIAFIYREGKYLSLAMRKLIEVCREVTPVE